MKRVIQHTSDKTAREKLKATYVMLAQFQPGVGADGIIFDIQARPGEHIKAHAARVAAQGDALEWVTKAGAEGDRLLKLMALERVHWLGCRYRGI